MSLGGIGPLEYQDICCAAAHRRVQCIQPVGTHQHNSWEDAIRKSINAANEGIDACPVFVMHLIGFARLGKRISLVNQENDATTRGTFGRLELTGLFERVLEGCRNELGHLANAALPARRKAQRQQRDVDVFLASDLVADGLCQFRLTRADISGKNHQSRSAE